MANSPVTFLDALEKAVADAATAYNSADELAPCVVLWPDKERQWEPLLAMLGKRRPVLTLSDYAPDRRAGPAYWVRCMVDRAIPEDRIADMETPMVYLPGLGVDALRNAEALTETLQPLIELQYRGCLFVQKSGRDWTPAAFLSSLGIETDGGADTAEALLRARERLADVPLTDLRQAAPLKAHFFNLLLTPDIQRDMLQWLDDPSLFHTVAGLEKWSAFLGQCLQVYGLDPEKDGAIVVARNMGLRQADAWKQLWERFAEAPERYPNIPERLRNAAPAGTLGPMDMPDSWPQENKRKEDTLRAALKKVEQLHPKEARREVRRLEDEHAVRRGWVWAAMGQAPLAIALQHLSALCASTQEPLRGVTAKDMALAYAHVGWKADDAALRALGAVQTNADIHAVGAVLRALYRPWVEECCTAFQKSAVNGGYEVKGLGPWPTGTCVLFCDGLRYDLAQRLKATAGEVGLTANLDWRFTALPSITATAKPAVTPVADLLKGGAGLDPIVAASGTLVTAEVLRAQIEQAGYQVLKDSEMGDPQERGWTELQNIDELGHTQTAKFPRLVDEEIGGMARRIQALLEAGWARVVVVTDHGWLLLPGDLPKAELPQHLTAGSHMRKGRCARLKPLTDTAFPTMPWYWDPSVRIAMAPGLNCFQAGKEYEHGGLSPQECVTPVLTVTRRAGGSGPCAMITKWRRMRCDIQVTNVPAGAAADIRAKAGDAASTLAGGPKSIAADGRVSLLVEDDAKEGYAAFVVVLLPNGTVAAQQKTTVGGGE